MLKARNNKGFTLAETLLVVGIIIILAALAFVSIINYMRTMTKLEYDNYAKEIFIAAQNHLSLAQREGYLGRKVFGWKETDLTTTPPAEEGVYVFVIDADTYGRLSDRSSLLGLMLPYGSLDDTVRQGGRYIIRYHKDSGTVLDVFYWEPNGRYALSYANDYASLMADHSKGKLQSYGTGKSVIGWYGGEDAKNLPRGTELKAPSIRVVNAETLYVVVTDPNASAHKLTLTIEGSKEQVTVDLKGAPSGTLKNEGQQYMLLLDDVTVEGHRFADLYPTLTPGEDLRLQVVARYDNALADVAYSATVTANSLFGNATKDGTAEIANIRHLENLDSSSGVDSTITAALQTSDLSWPEFQSAIKSGPWTDGTTPTYHPVSPKDGFTAYDGDSLRISGVEANVTDGDAGVFGELTGGSVKDLMLVDCSANGVNAGALAGRTTSTKVTNVVAVHSGSAAPAIRGSANAGGLIGSASGGDITNCAAALVVESGAGNAGGLIGETPAGPRGPVVVTGSYAGGHTTKGKYTANNVTGVTAGGLIGAAYTASVSYSYSTCSVSGGTAGGFVGTAEGTLSDCYATGRVLGTTRGAFAGSYSGTADQCYNCYYYKIVNEAPKDGDAAKGFTYLPPMGSGTGDVTAFDESAGAFSSFTGAVRAKAAPYDATLGGYYQNNYPLKTYVTGDVFVATHYGDWPAPETWVINK